MITIGEAKRLVKRAILANVTCSKRDLAITPLVSGRHGIGKSQMIKSIAVDLGGTCITVEGGTLKEGEITGLPYQYEDKDGNVSFRFLPYYAVERIQQEERRIYESCSEGSCETDFLAGSSNRFALNDLSPAEKIEALRSGRIRPVILFIDEINRTESSVYKELMNILLTRSVNGYDFPWWVFFVGAMNPSTQNSVYATNEMDPAQLDRFLKIKVGGDPREWVEYGEKSGVSKGILDFIRENPKCLLSDQRELDDEEKPTPSPRGWDMVDTLMSSEPMLRPFFSEEENSPEVVEKDLKILVSSKLGATVSTMFFASLAAQVKALTPDEVFADDASLSRCSGLLASMSVSRRIQTCDLLLAYLKENLEFLMLADSAFEKKKAQLAAFVACLDAPTRLLFAQNVASATTDDGNSMMELLFDVFEKDLISVLDVSDRTRSLIEVE